ncbi:AbrB/MazE/SpoVT family DNA-binding domain-containing protein [Candidatus Amarolinea dominans]|uniref:AbrB/MazE/SpoVT family DNA-binding domain-containing protein n=1 Tax=Candidatus Amarolinea dominans TaxID=3140696 RepID=UPI001D414A0D|nr:AbrB/MazE/SpoVT family DNA-binding domain-containing protein [Anaerolineae bacterium]
MTVAIQTRIVRIGNSQDSHPKPLLEQAGIGDSVELEVHDGQISIRPARRVRAGWAKGFAAMAMAGDDPLLDGAQLTATTWDEEEWEW